MVSLPAVSSVASSHNVSKAFIVHENLFRGEPYGHSNTALMNPSLPRCFTSLVYASFIPSRSIIATFTASLKSR